MSIVELKLSKEVLCFDLLVVDVVSMLSLFVHGFLLEAICRQIQPLTYFFVVSKTIIIDHGAHHP